MTSGTRVYLDHAATSWPKPEEVYTAMDRFHRDIGVAAARGVYEPALAAGRTVAQTRLALAGLLGAASPDQIVFTAGGTAALNLAIHGLLRPGDHVVTTVTEHNSVLRPLFTWRQQGAQVTYIDCDDAGYVDPQQVLAAVRPETRVVVMNHASNVTGAVQSIADVGQGLTPRHIPLLVDAAQSLGHVPIDVRQMGIGLLAAPGHKGLLGPLGTGLLYVDPVFRDILQPVVQGGTGSFSQLENPPETWPDRFEAGSLNTPAIAGLLAGIQYLVQHNTAAKQLQQRQQLRAFLDACDANPSVARVGPSDEHDRVGVVSFNVDPFDCQELATLLDAQFGIQGRAGLHCAPRMHDRLGTRAAGGTFRVSVGLTSRPDDLTRAATALADIGAF